MNIYGAKSRYELQFEKAHINKADLYNFYMRLIRQEVAKALKENLTEKEMNEMQTRNDVSHIQKIHSHYLTHIQEKFLNGEIALEDFHLLKIEKENYDSIFEEFIEITKNKVAFFQKLFPGLSQVTASKISYAVDENVFSHKEKVFEEGDTADCFYVVKYGEVEVITFMSVN